MYQTKFVPAVGLGLAVALAGAVVGAAAWWGRPGAVPAAPPAPPPPTPRQKADAVLKAADRAADAAAERHLAAVRDYFDDRASNAGRFAERATSLRGGLLLVSGRLGLRDRDAHARFLRAAFEETVLTPDGVQAALDRAAAEYRRDLERVDGRFLIDLRADLPDAGLPPADARVVESEAAFKAAYARLLASALPALERDVAGTAATELTSLYLGNLAAHGLLRAGAAAGLAATGWGAVVAVNLGAGVVIDRLVRWVLDRLGYNPAGEVADAVRRSVGQMRDGVLNGDGAAGRAYDAARKRQAASADPAERARLKAEADAVAASGRLGLARQFGLMKEARAAVRRAIAVAALAAPRGGVPAATAK